VIEDITLRSVRIRTNEQTVLSIPAGVLAQASIENFASRGKILLQTLLCLAHGTSATQVRAIRDGIQTLLAQHPLVESETARVRLAGFTPRGVELELFAYIRTADMARYKEVQEELLLHAAVVVEAEGSSFAGPPPWVEAPGSTASGAEPLQVQRGRRGAWS
jgi:MscS family membrane protein